MAQGYAPLAGRKLLRREAIPSATLYVIGYLVHGLPTYGDAFAACDRSHCLVDGSKYLGATSLALDPQIERLLKWILGVANTARSNRLANEILLLWSQGYLHEIKVRPGI